MLRSVHLPLLIAILAVAAILRFWRLDGQGFLLYDEGQMIRECESFGKL